MPKFNGDNMHRINNNQNLKPKPILLFLIVFVLFTLSSLFAQNQMELIAEFTGEHPRSEFGFQVASLDFNGDGIDDLAIGAYRWDPEYPGWPAQANHWGKIYFYLGPLGINNSVDFTISGFDSLRSFGKHLANLGDMNGDGYEDLGYRTSYYDYEEELSHNCANILFGNNVMDSIPDYIYDFPGNEFIGNHTPSLKWLGDINGDGYDDAGFVVSKRLGTNEDEDWIYLIYGNEFELHYFSQFDYTTWWTSINGIGDVNNDSFSDFIIGHDEYTYITKQLHFGETEIDSIPDMILTDMIPYPYYDTTGGVAIGDWNGDGIDDFNVGIDSEGPDIWFGSESNLTQNMHLNFYDWLVNRNNDFGDLNADGKDDFVAGNPGSMGGFDGDAYIYLGCQNGTYDYNLEGDYGVGLGWSVTIGNFNNDNCYDIAVGGTGYNAGFQDSSYCGKVYVYAGNADLVEADPNIAVEEDIVPNPVIEFNAYPNPFNPIVTFEIKAEGFENLQIDIFNIKGQRVDELEISNQQLEEDDNSHCRILWNAENHPSGVYFCKLVCNNNILSVKKVTLLK